MEYQIDAVHRHTVPGFNSMVFALSQKSAKTGDPAGTRYQVTINRQTAYLKRLEAELDALKALHINALVRVANGVVRDIENGRSEANRGLTFDQALDVTIERRITDALNLEKRILENKPRGKVHAVPDSFSGHARHEDDPDREYLRGWAVPGTRTRHPGGVAARRIIAREIITLDVAALWSPDKKIKQSRPDVLAHDRLASLTCSRWVMAKMEHIHMINGHITPIGAMDLDDNDATRRAAVGKAWTARQAAEARQEDERAAYAERMNGPKG